MLGASLLVNLLRKSGIARTRGSRRVVVVVVMLTPTLSHVLSLVLWRTINIPRLETQCPWFMRQPGLQLEIITYGLRADFIRPARWRMSFSDIKYYYVFPSHDVSFGTPMIHTTKYIPPQYTKYHILESGITPTSLDSRRSISG
jgi:hypothetical protein